MRTQRLVIPLLPQLNDYTRQCRANRFGANKLKGNAEDGVILCCKQQKIKPVEGRAYFKIAYYDKDKRIDNDNRAHSKKYIFDALVKAGVLRDDGRKHLVQPIPWCEEFYTDKGNPRIEITIYDMEQK